MMILSECLAQTGLGREKLYRVKDSTRTGEKKGKLIKRKKKRVIVETGGNVSCFRAGIHIISPPSLLASPIHPSLYLLPSSLPPPAGR